jgi:broad specificity phosphatase PhoE
MLYGAKAGLHANLPDVDFRRRTAVTAIVHLVRHGEVVNPDRLLYGRLPGFPLSSLGRRHAEEFSSRFRDRPIAEVISSPLERAQQTGRIIAELLDVQLRTDPRLVESWARFEGRKFTYRPYFRPAEWRYYRNPWKPTWGEPFSDIAERMSAAVLDARPAGGQGEVICVSHAATIYTARRYFEGRRIQHLASARIADYLSATSISFEGDLVSDVSYREFPIGSSSEGRPLTS